MKNKNSILNSPKSNLELIADELQFFEETLFLLENQINSLVTASNAMLITISSLTKVLYEKGVITEKDVTEMSVKVTDDLKEKAKDVVEKRKIDDKESLYNDILNSDLGGNA